MNRRALSALALAGVAACTESTQPRLSRRAEADVTSAVNAPVPGGGAIAFHSNRAGNFDIWVMNADGSGATQVTNNGGLTFGPRFSPDGARIAFSSNRDGDFEIYVINTDGTGLTQLTHIPRDFEPTWSPDGKRIAFNSNRDGDFHVFVMNADGSGVTQLTHDVGVEDEPTAWSPDGKRLAFVSTRTGEHEIFLMNPDGTGVTQLTHNEGEGDEAGWSPDGRRFLFSSTRDGGRLQIFVMNADGSGVTQLTSDAFTNDDPVWSPDGKKIAFQSTRDGHEEIYVMNADGGGQTRLTFTNAGIFNAVATWRAELLPTAATCPTPANVVVSNEAGLSAALAAASPGQVIALNGFIVVSVNVVINTSNITLTCATPGSGLTLQAGVIPTVDAVLNALGSGDVVEHLVLVGTPDADAFFAGAANVRFANNTVTCGTGTVAAFYNAAPGGVIIGNQVREAGCFDGIHLQFGTDGSRVEGNTLVATAPNQSPRLGAIRVRDGSGVTIANNSVLGPWTNGITLADLSNSSVARNFVQGVLAYGIRARAGLSLRPGPVSIDGNLFSANIVTGAGAAGIFLRAACNNTFLGNNLQGNAGNVGAIFDLTTGANVFVGNQNVVIDNGAFDCNGDGVLDPNIISGPGSVLHGQFSPAPEDFAGSGKLH